VERQGVTGKQYEIVRAGRAIRFKRKVRENEGGLPACGERQPADAGSVDPCRMSIAGSEVNAGRSRIARFFAINRKNTPTFFDI
jgi:hypothetical protein